MLPGIQARDEFAELRERVHAKVEALRAGAGSKADLNRSKLVAGVRDVRTGRIHLATNADAIPLAELHPLLQKRVETQRKILQTNQQLIAGGLTTSEIARLTNEQLRLELSQRGVSDGAAGMDVVSQLRRTNARVKYNEDRLSSLGRGFRREDWQGMENEIGNHAEVVALDEGLKAIDGREATVADLASFQLHTEYVPLSQTDPKSAKPFPRCDHCRGLTEGALLSPELAGSEELVDRRVSERWTS